MRLQARLVVSWALLSLAPKRLQAVRLSNGQSRVAECRREVCLNSNNFRRLSSPCGGIKEGKAPPPRRLRQVGMGSRPVRVARDLAVSVDGLSRHFPGLLVLLLLEISWSNSNALRAPSLDAARNRLSPPTWAAFAIVPAQHHLKSAPASKPPTKATATSASHSCPGLISRRLYLSVLTRDSFSVAPTCTLYEPIFRCRRSPLQHFGFN